MHPISEGKATYTNYEIIVIENNSTEPATFEYYDKLKKDGIQVLYYPGSGLIYSAINNWGVKNCKGEYLLFLNNDIEVITPVFIVKCSATVRVRESVP